MRVASQVTVEEEIKTCDLRKLGNFKKTSNMHGIKSKFLVGQLNTKLSINALENLKKSAFKVFIEIPILLDFINQCQISTDPSFALLLHLLPLIQRGH